MCIMYLIAWLPLAAQESNQQSLHAGHPALGLLSNSPILGLIMVLAI